MSKSTFELTDEHTFIPLDKLLKLLGIAESGGMAHMMIDDGLVRVNDVVAHEKRKKLRLGDVVLIDDVEIKITQDEA